MIILEDKGDGIDVKFDPHPEVLRKRLKLDPNSETIAEFLYSRAVGAIAKAIQDKKQQDKVTGSGIHLL
jgi:hypothetical protein